VVELTKMSDNKETGEGGGETNCKFDGSPVLSMT
jgi:hypothetical protein